MSITQELAKNSLTEWQKLTSGSRDKIVFDVLFDHDENENPPMFSDNVKDNAATNNLVDKLTQLGIASIVIEKAPRSTLSIVRCGDIVLPLMPAHKAIGYIGYLVAVSFSE